MPVTTIHQFVDQYPVKPTDTRLILGTIHPHNVETFKMPFFYGNKEYFWKHLGKAFPCQNFSNKESIIQILEKNHVWISDIIRQCDRENTGVFKDEDLFNVKLNTTQIENGLVSSKIEKIYFTSAFGCNNTAKLFTTAFGINYTKTWDEMKREFKIPRSHFGREITGVVIYSPTGGANRGIAKGKLYKNWKKENWNGFDSPVNTFKISHYKEKMNFLDFM